MEKMTMKKALIFILTLALTVAALASCGGGMDYSQLEIIDLGLDKEYFGIAFRTGSDMTRKVEDITLELINEGLFDELSEKYEVGAVNADEYIPSAEAFADSEDWEYIKNKGTLVIGITDYKPMDYKNDKGEWVGFDADYARAVCEKLGVKAEFKEIVWDYKTVSLAAKEIDCIWNGMTITDEVQAAADCTVPYMYNTQVAVVKKSNASNYTDLASFAGASVAVEGGSAGAKVANGNESVAPGVKEVKGQTDALLEVLSGAADAAIVDLLLAKALIK